MLTFSKLLTLTLLSSLALTSSPSLFSSSSSSSVFVSAATLNPVSISGSELIDSVTGSRWIVRGSGYDYAVDDTSIANWQPALEGLLGEIPELNMLRLYVVDPTLPYTEFMNWCASKGIYVVVPLTGTVGCSVLNRDGTPGLTDPNSCYPSCLLNYGQQVVNAFSQYTNTLAYVIANEVMNSEARWNAAGCVKSYLRDIKNYQYSCSNYGMRYVPVIYTAADNPITGYTAEGNDRLKLDYLTCGDDESARIDSFGMNLFRWCSDTCTFSTCGSDLVTNALKGNGAPIILTEYGCDQFHLSSDPSQLAQRDWKETDAIYSPDMLSYWSGASAYTYGIRGGIDFAFFSGGSSDASGPPGLNKSCGFPNNECNVDNYAAQMAAVAGNSIPPILNIPVSSRNYTCPSVSGVDLSIPSTRQDVDGYTKVYCPVSSNGGTGSGSGTVTGSTSTGISNNGGGGTSGTNTTGATIPVGTSTGGSTSNAGNTNGGGQTTNTTGSGSANAASGLVVSPAVALVSALAVTFVSLLL